MYDSDSQSVNHSTPGPRTSFIYPKKTHIKQPRKGRDTPL